MLFYIFLIVILFYYFLARFYFIVMQLSRRGWHVLDQKKSKYFLVDVIKQVANGQKTVVKYHGETFQIPTTELLPYQLDKPSKLSDLQHANKAEILDWMSQNGLQQKWVRLNSRVVLDFGVKAQTQKYRMEHIGYLLGRFLVSYRKKQYLLVASDTLEESNQHTIHQILIQSLSQITSLWPYALQLPTLNFIYKSFFSTMPIKFQIYIKEAQIIKLSILPYNCQSREFIGQNSDNIFEVLSLKSPIFAILNGSTRDMKRYYKIPEKINSPKSQITVNNLIDSCLEIGLKADEINELVGLFVVILSINQLQFQRIKKEDKSTYFKLREGQIRQSLCYWLGDQLTSKLQTVLNVQNSKEGELKDIRMKQTILIRLIYQQALRFAADLLNSKMINFNASYTQQVRKFIFVEFPAVRCDFQQSIHNEKLIQVNEQIKKTAFKVVNSNKVSTLSEENIQSKIKEQYSYDINKEILKEMEKSNQWQKKLKEGEFMRTFKTSKLKIKQADQAQNKKKYNLQQLYQQIDLLYIQQESTFANFIIRSQLTKNGPKKGILQQIQSSIEQKRCRKQQQQDQRNQGWIELYSFTFGKRYKFCEVTKNIYKLKLSIFDGLKVHFAKHPGQGKVKEINQNQVVFLALQTYKQLEAERKVHDIMSDKIKKQFKKFNYRRQFIQSVHKTSLKIKFFKFLLPKVYPPMKEAFKTIRMNVSSTAIFNILLKRYLDITKKVFQQMKKRAAIQKIQHISKQFSKKQLKAINAQFYRKLKQIEKKKRMEQNTQKMFIAILKKKLSNQRDAFQSIKQMVGIKQAKLRHQKDCQKAVLKLNKFILNHALSKIKKQPILHNNSLNIAPSHPNEHKIEKTNPNDPNLHNGNKNDSNNNLNVPNNFANSNPANVPKNRQSLEPKPNQPNKSQQVSSPALSSQEEPLIHINQPLEVLERPVAAPAKLQSNQMHSFKSNKDQGIIKQENNENSGQYTSRHSNAPSSVGFEKSQTSRVLTKQELYSLQDHPTFSFDIWLKQAKGFQKKKPLQPQNPPVVKLLFNKPETVRPPNIQPPQELNVDILIKQKVVLNPFFPYLMDHITASSQQQLQNVMSHQQHPLKQPLLKKYPLKQYAQVPTITFNNILKIGKDKNTTRSPVLMINDIIKPVRDSYYKSEKVSTVFDGQPSLVADYSWSHNIIKDEIFLQFIKQIMMNEIQQSLRELVFALQIITRYYYPSPQFIYAFLHYLKSLQSKNIQKLNQCFTNTLLFAQAFQKYKGNSVTVLKEEVLPKEKESYNRLLMRNTEFSQGQMEGIRTITLRLFNQQKFQYKIRNENLSLFKRKLLKVISLLPYQDYFGLYYCKLKGSGMLLIQDNIKAIDFVNKNPQTETGNILYVRIKNYFPFSLKEINKTKTFYLNSLIQQRSLPWKEQNYQNVVALAMLFDEFQQYRITNYVLLSGQEANHNLNISKIEGKYNELSSQKGQKVNELEYLKLVKENDFLAAKAYRVKEDLLSPLGIVDKIIIKPLQLCFYQDKVLKSSVHLNRIKAYYFEKGTINLQMELKDHDSQCLLRQLTLTGVEKAYQFYLDLSIYIEYLIDK